MVVRAPWSSVVTVVLDLENWTTPTETIIFALHLRSGFKFSTRNLEPTPAEKVWLERRSGRYISLRIAVYWNFTEVDCQDNACHDCRIRLHEVLVPFVNGESAATHTGIAITLLTSFLGGMFAPYPALPPPLQIFARIHPIASANASIVFRLEGEDFVGYNPLNIAQTSLTITLSLLILVIGLVLYSRRCWRKR